MYVDGSSVLITYLITYLCSGELLFNTLTAKHLLQAHAKIHMFVFDEQLPLVFGIMIWNYK